MKVKIIEKSEKKVFKPKKLEITIESLEELTALWLRLNMSHTGVRNHHETTGRYEAELRNFKNGQDVPGLFPVVDTLLSRENQS
jgi:hypothetical protein